MKSKPNKFVKPIITTIIIIGVLFILLHITPKTALRTHVFFTGHPWVAITSDVDDYEFDQSDEKEKLEALNVRTYTMTKPPIDGEKLFDWNIKKRSFLYFANYYQGEI